MLDALNERLTVEGGDPIAFDSDCPEGICGTCGLVINGISRRLGHSSITITADIYSHISPATAAESAKRLANLIDDAI